MSFASEIGTLLTSDSSLNEWCDGGIRNENLIDEWLSETDDNLWIVYGFNVEEQGNCLTNYNLYLNYSLNVVIIQRDHNDQLDIIAKRLRDYLNSYTGGNIVDIVFIREGVPGLDQQKNVYSLPLEFLCIYCES